MLKVHYFPPSPRAFKVLAALHHLELPFEPRIVDLFKGEQKQPAFAAEIRRWHASLMALPAWQKTQALVAPH